MGCNEQWLCKDCVAKWILKTHNVFYTSLLKTKKFSIYGTILICTFDIDYQCLHYNTRVQESATIYDADVNVTIRLNIYKCQFSAKNLIENINPENFSLILNPVKTLTLTLTLNIGTKKHGFLLFFKF